MKKLKVLNDVPARNIPFILEFKGLVNERVFFGYLHEAKNNFNKVR